ncbi:aldo/keto reductase [Amycolatopsis jiangsuensis]|uniref:Aryl-alcohol dehydrogenase-like predicted oxidoreductase n=1 Tax=Amycolatopsis jiangsuensis TaxID=1181879 RepID=A0A840IRS5_9PSEU|nr:aldo/keto reductase [Amycolatopsis jiangsuensis]MBB4684239.1 aryl-alcohol dehydrogenase-like predicted oxidoreductase [Amycolatopsis jiangsuensis]
MEYRRLGRSGLRVSVLTMGTMTFGGKDKFGLLGDTDVAGARRQIDQCLDAGVNLIDTANMYSAGKSEEIVGEAVSGRRDQVLISTKVRFAMGKGPNDDGLSRHHIVAQAEASLRRLGTDHIDLYHVHEWDGQTPLEETLEALDTLVRSGKVRYLGVSNYSGWQLMKALATADAHGYQRFVSNQIYYSLESRDAEFELVPASLDQGLGVLVWSPLAGGLLSGKYRRGQQAADGRHLTEWSEPPVRDEEKLYDTIETVVDIASGHGVSPAQVSLAYLLAKPGVTSLVIGARRDEQLADNLGAADVHLTQDEVDRLDRVSAPVLAYPYWHQAAGTSARFSDADRAWFGPAR